MDILPRATPPTTSPHGDDPPQLACRERPGFVEEFTQIRHLAYSAFTRPGGTMPQPNSASESPA
jgi:hypothetical protein